jgi:hypothetical protein
MDWCVVTSQIIAQWVGITVGGLTIATTLGRWFIVTPLKRYIEQQTHPIQPDANGGKSLPDVAVAIARVETKLDNVDSWLTKVDQRLIEHIKDHQG